MKREVKEYKRNGSRFPEVVILDVRDLYHGQYSVEKKVTGGYEMIYSSVSLDKCIKKAESVFAKMNQQHTA